MRIQACTCVDQAVAQGWGLIEHQAQAQDQVGQAQSLEIYQGQDPEDQAQGLGIRDQGPSPGIEVQDQEDQARDQEG